MLKLGRASDDEVPDIAHLMNRAYRGTDAEAGWNSEAGYMRGDRASAASLRRELAQSPNSRMLVWRGEEAGAIAGCVWLNPIADHAWELGSLAIDPAVQARGLGSELLDAAESWVDAEGGRTVRITVVNVRDRLIGWYERRGYVLTGETEPYPYQDCPFGEPTRPDLCFVVLKKTLAAAGCGPIEGSGGRM